MNNWHRIFLLIFISISTHLFGCSTNSGSVNSNFAQNPQSLKPVSVEAHGGFFACKVYSKDKNKNATSNSYYYFPASTESRLVDQDYGQILKSNSDKAGVDYFSLDKNKLYEKITVKECEGLPASLHENRTEIIYVKDNKEYQITGWMIKKSDNTWSFINPLQRLSN
ncbi:hypothetical protein NIES4071_38710 [Calothrix sp. NIES-4071]|nr:hypothetical protein NIES4071_38710 [Calothrix sp. NIES-4071]BAZ58189.1 hypothetical protein NIES4105_38650 [Calothrix sp. NIES-4105]